MRIAFIGATEFSWHMLEELLANEADVAAVFTLKPQAGRTIPDYRDLAELTINHHVPCFSTERIDVDENLQRLRWLKPDIIVVMGLERPIPQGFLDVPPLGVIKSFPALLPSTLGHIAIPWAILSGQERAGLTFCYLKGDGDKGEGIFQTSWSISVEDSSASLYRRTVSAGREMIRDLLDRLASGPLTSGHRELVRSEAMCAWVAPDGEIRWDDSSRAVYDLIRAWTHPFGGAFSHVEGRRLTVWKGYLSYEGQQAAPGEVIAVYEKGVEVACSAGSVILQIVQIGDGPEEPARRAFDRLGIRPGSLLGEGRDQGSDERTRADSRSDLQASSHSRIR